MTFTIFGVPVDISPATLILIIWFLWNGFDYLKAIVKNEPGWKYLLAALTMSVAVLASVAIHELSHGITATFFGIPIVGAGSSFWGAYVVEGGDLSTLPPIAEFAVALAGPLSNILIGLLTVPLVFSIPDSIGEGMIQFICRINFRLAFLNLAPIFIFDGAKVLDAILRMMSLDPGNFWIWAFFAVPMIIGLMRLDRKVALWVEEVG